MNIIVLGSGSLGCAMGGLLAASGCDVILVNRNQSLVDVINRQGLLLRAAQGDRRVAVRAVTSCADLAPADLVLVLVKSFDTESAIASARSVLGPRTVVLSLQNGLGHEEILSAAVGSQRVMVGRTYVGGQINELAEVIVGAAGKETYIGELDGSVSDRAQHIAQTFTNAGLHTQAVDNIMGVVWDKLLVNAATGALSGVTRLPYGGLYSLPALQDCAEQAVAEGMAVARALGISISFSAPSEPWFKAGKGLPAEFKASILQSIERGARTEVDFINGAIVRWGERVGVPTPVNRALVAAIKGIELSMHYRVPNALTQSA